MKPIKIPVNFLGVKIAAQFVRTKHWYEHPISTYTAKRCYKAAAKILMDGKVFPNQEVEAKIIRHECGPVRLSATWARFMRREGKFRCFSLDIEWSYTFDSYIVRVDPEWIEGPKQDHPEELEGSADYLGYESPAIAGDEPLLIGCE